MEAIGIVFRRELREHQVKKIKDLNVSVLNEINQFRKNINDTIHYFRDDITDYISNRIAVTILDEILPKPISDDILSKMEKIYYTEHKRKITKEKIK